jgi:hypothetical protein
MTDRFDRKLILRVTKYLDVFIRGYVVAIPLLSMTDGL